MSNYQTGQERKLQDRAMILRGLLGVTRPVTLGLIFLQGMILNLENMRSTMGKLKVSVTELKLISRPGLRE